jgi:CBS domain-containing protein
MIATGPSAGAAVPLLASALDETAGLPASGALLGLCALAGICAAVGAVCAASLLVYSPTKLARDELGRRLVLHLEGVEREYQVVARLLMLGGVSAAAFLAWFGAGGSPLFRGVVVGLVGVVLLLLVGVMPAQLAEARAESAVRLTVRLLNPLRALLRFVLALPLLHASRAILRLFRIAEGSRMPEPDEIADDILAAVSDSAQDVELPDEERRWIENIVELKSMHASEVMTPRTDMVSFPSSMPLLEAVGRAIEAGFSRYPVYDTRIDDVVGVFYAKDALEVLGKEGDLGARPVGQMVRKPIFVPESMSLVDLLRLFRATKKQLAVVLDEYGRPRGDRRRDRGRVRPRGRTAGQGRRGRGGHRGVRAHPDRRGERAPRRTPARGRGLRHRRRLGLHDPRPDPEGRRVGRDRQGRHPDPRGRRPADRADAADRPAAGRQRAARRRRPAARERRLIDREEIDGSGSPLSAGGRLRGHAESRKPMVSHSLRPDPPCRRPPARRAARSSRSWSGSGSTSARAAGSSRWCAASAAASRRWRRAPTGRPAPTSASSTS